MANVIIVFLITVHLDVVTLARVIVSMYLNKSIKGVIPHVIATTQKSAIVTI